MEYGILIAILCACIVFIICMMWKDKIRNGDKVPEDECIFKETVCVNDYTKEELADMIAEKLRTGELLDMNTKLVVKMKRKEARDYAKKVVDQIYEEIEKDKLK